MLNVNTFVKVLYFMVYNLFQTIKFYRYRTIKQENAFTHNLAGAMNRYDDWNRLSVRILEELEIPIRGQRQIQVNHESVDPTDIDSAAWTAMKTATYFHKLVILQDQILFYQNIEKKTNQLFFIFRYFRKVTNGQKN